jgi:hypothetical protein
MRRAVLAVLLSLLAGASAMAALPPADTDTAAWFERFKAEATDEELYRFLYAMPKGGDLHNHLSGSILSEWFYDLALQQAERGYRYYTRVRIENCRPYGGNAFVESPYLLMFVTIFRRAPSRRSMPVSRVSTGRSRPWTPRRSRHGWTACAWKNPGRVATSSSRPTGSAWATCTGTPTSPPMRC